MIRYLGLAAAFLVAGFLFAQSGVMKDVPAGTKWGGSPAVPQREFLRQGAILRRLTTSGREPSAE